MVEEFRGSYTCSMQTLMFRYDGTWEVRRGVIHWAARMRYLSAFWDARGTRLEDRPDKMAEAVRHAVEQWIEAFSCGQRSAR